MKTAELETLFKRKLTALRLEVDESIVDNIYDTFLELKKAYATQQAEDRWIPVERELPEIGQEVIVYCPKSDKKVTALCRFKRFEESETFYWDNFYGGNFTHIQEAVTHWQPLPPSPKQ